MRTIAFDYLLKPFDPDKIKSRTGLQPEPYRHNLSAAKLAGKHLSRIILRLDNKRLDLK